MREAARTELYGLVIASEQPIPGGRPPAAASPVDVTVHLTWPADVAARGAREGEFYRSETEVGGVPTLIADRPGGARYVRLTYAEGMRFLLRADGGEVWCEWDAPLTRADAMTFLLGPVLGLVLRLRGELAVHASAVVHEGRAWAFVGPGGSGKSTLAAALARDGLPLLTEDVLALRPVEGRWLGWPAYAHFRLWSDSPALREGEADRLPPLSPTWPKRELAFDAAGIASAAAPVPMGAWVILADPPPIGDAGGGASRLVPIRGADVIRALVENTYMNYLLDLPAQGAQLRAIGEVVRAIPAFRLELAWEAAALAATVRQLRAAMRTL